ncbi:hypothetical protein [Sporosarcina ureae]|uniref:hypothetical protein n=1 Tax=Sporosarcina ureae TaxID=1571 RepID=UPI0026EC1BF8|nr:hypothetical protein [Sporosarcina ureae]
MNHYNSVSMRLMIDSEYAANENLSVIESRAFMIFSEKVQERLAIWTENKPDEIGSVYTEFRNEMYASLEVINEIKELISAQDLTVLSISLRILLQAYYYAIDYRYRLGLADSPKTFEEYADQKISEIWGLEVDFSPDFSFPTMQEPFEVKEPYILQIESAFKRWDGEMIALEMNEEKPKENTILGLHTFERQTLAGKAKFQWEILAKPAGCLPNTETLSSNRRMTSSERRVLQEIYIHALQNHLRKAYLAEYESNIQELLFALNVMYHTDLIWSNIQPEETPVTLRNEKKLDASFIQTGLLGVSMNQAAEIYADNIKMRGTRGHGFAAEKANDLVDRVLGRDAEIIGDDNAKNGADRIVDGDFIQTKYCSTGGRSISECFDKGQFRYVTADNQPMQIEVPKDQYDQAVQSMQDRISRGDMKDLGITDPAEAKTIIRKGNVTYKTAQRIAKAGTIEGIGYDIGKGMVTGVTTFGVSATVSFGLLIWRGGSADEALGAAIEDGSKVFGRHLVQHALTQQISRTTIEQSMRPMTDYVVKQMIGSKTTAQIVNTFFRSASQTPIYGAAALNHLSKLMRGNIVTMTITTTVLSAGSIYDILNGRISSTQFMKNVGKTGGGVGGAVAGAAIGSVVPVVGTWIGGFIGGVIGSKVSGKVIDSVAADDADALVLMIREKIAESAEELAFTQPEVNFIADYVFTKELSKRLKEMYKVSDKEEYVEDWLDPYFIAILKARPAVKSMDSMLQNEHEALRVTEEEPCL